MEQPQAGQTNSSAHMQWPPFPPLIPPYANYTNSPPDPAQLYAYHAAMAQIIAAQTGINPVASENSSAGEKVSAAQSQAHAEADPMIGMAQQTINNTLDEEQAGIFNQLVGIVGMNDKDFWKGTLVGAAAVLILTNDTVKGSLMSLLATAGDKVKTTGDNVKESATQTASNVKENISASSDIFRDTYQAGKDGFKESMERQKKNKVDGPNSTGEAEVS